MTSVLPTRPLPRGAPLPGSARFRRFTEAAALLVVLVGLTYLLPERLVISNLASIGRPAIVLGLAMAAWWCLTRLHPDLATRGAQPVRWAMAGYVVSLLLGYLSGQLRPLTALEQNGSVRTVLVGFAFVGVALVAADGLATRRHLDLVLRALVAGAAALAAIGVVQFVLRRDVTEYLALPPLLTFAAPPVGLAERGGGDMIRVAGTTGHYIEFSVLLALALPLAVHFTRYAATRTQRQLYAAVTGLLALAIPLAVARTGVLALFIVLALLSVVWTWRTRINAAAVALLLLIVVHLFRPGLIGTFRSLLLDTEDDPSIVGRTADYAVVFPMIAEDFWLGRGVGTFLPELYRLLDNQWLLTMITGGVVGVAGLAAVYLTGAALGVSAYRDIGRRRDNGELDAAAAAEDRHLAMALTAAIVTSMLSALTFDALYMRGYTVTVALLVGVAGAYWRLVRRAETP